MLDESAPQTAADPTAHLVAAHELGDGDHVTPPPLPLTAPPLINTRTGEPHKFPSDYKWPE